MRVLRVVSFFCFGVCQYGNACVHAYIRLPPPSKLSRFSDWSTCQVTVSLRGGGAQGQFRHGKVPVALKCNLSLNNSVVSLKIGGLGAEGVGGLVGGLGSGWMDLSDCNSRGGWAEWVARGGELPVF